jgi:hypothetical protein
MKLSGHEINSQLRQKLEMPTGRHLYVVLGTYERLERYEKVDLREARSPSGQRLGDPVNEILFAYDLELNCLRIRATNQKHILILLPGEKVGDRITLFHEAASNNHRSLPTNLVPENHLWELNE